MTSREILLAAIKKEKVDRIPVSPDFYHLFPMKFKGLTTWDVWGSEPTVPLWKVKLEAYKHFGFDAWIFVDDDIDYAFGTETDKKIISRDSERIETEYIYHTKRGDLTRRECYPKYDGVWTTKHMIDNPLADLEKIKSLLSRPPGEYFPYDKFKEVKTKVGEDGLVFVYGGIPALNWWLHLRSSQKGIMDIYDCLAQIKPVWEMYEEIDLERVRIACKAGVEVIYGGGSYSSLSIISPDWYKKFAYPHLKKSAEICHSNGAYFCIQCNGKSNEVLELIAEAGVDCLEPLERPPLGNVDISDAKRRIGKKVCLRGNADPVNTLLKGSPQDIEEEVKEIIEKAGEGNGLILGTSDQVARDTPIENIMAFREAAEKYGKI